MDTGGSIVRHIPDPHSSDGLTSEDESDFETEPLETSSSNSQESDSGNEVFQRDQRCQRRCQTPSSSEESIVSKDVPDWFQDKAFLYSGRISLMAIPGMFLVLIFSGDVLLVLVTIGSLVIYLLYNAGSKQKALLAYIVTFVTIQLTVVYSVIPLLWKSVLNLVVILALNVYTFMTGGWILLLFEDFRFHDEDLLVLIESGLFSLYPAVFIVLVTWSVAVLTSVSVAPYVLMLVGFIVLQVFLSPTASSFVKLHPQGSIAVWDLPTGYILDPNTVATIAMLYATASPFNVVIIKLMTGWQALFSLFFLVQTLFVASCSIFLATFLNLRLFLESHGIQQKYLLILRWSASFTAIVLLLPLLALSEINSNLLPWMPLILSVYVSIVVCHLQRQKAAVHGSLLILLLGFFLIFCQLPWNLEYYVADGSLSITWLQLLLVINAALCIFAMYSAIYLTNDALGLCLFMQSVCYTCVARILLSSGLISFLLLLILVSLFSYLSIRLYHSNKLSWQHSLLILSMHVTALLTNVSYLYQKSSLFEDFDQSSSLWGNLLSAYEFLSTLFLVIIVLHVIVFEQTNISQREILRYLVFLVTAVLCSSPILLTNLLYILLGTKPVFSAYLGLGILLISCVYIKLVCFNNSLSSRNNCYAVALTVLPVLTLVLQPHLSMKSEELQKWSVIIGLFCVMVALLLARTYRNSLHILGSCLGLPLAFCSLHLLFPSHPSLLIRLMLGLKVMLTVVLLLVAWQNPRHSNKWIKTLVLMIGATSGVLLLLENTIGVEWLINAGTASTIIVFILVAMVIKVRSSSHEQDLLDGHLEHNCHICNLAVLGNMYTLASCGLFFWQWRSSEHWYIWFCLFLPSLLLLNKDDLLFASLSPLNRLAPVATAIVLILSIATVFESGFINGTTMFARWVGFFELLTFFFTVPVMLNFWTVCWWGSYWWSDKLVVFLTPVYFLFFFLGCSYASWIMAIFGLAIGAWLMKCKLPLDVDR